MFSGKAKHYFHQLKGTANKHYEEEFLTVGDGFPVENKCGGRGIGVVNTMRKWCCRFFKKMASPTWSDDGTRVYAPRRIER